MYMVGLDLFHGMLLQANKRRADINWVQGDNTDLPFIESSFDYVTNQFSYHPQHKSRMFAEIYRIIKPGGRFAITNIDPWSMPGWIVYTSYGLKTSTEETKNKYPSFPTIYEQKSKLTMLEIGSVILKRSI